MRVFHQHLIARDAHTVEAQVTVVVGVHAEFGPDLTDDNARQWLLGLFTTQLDEEGVCSMALAFSVQLSHHNGVVGSFSQRSGSPFVSC